MKYLRALILAGGLLLLWQILVSLSGVPAFILPGPWPVAKALATHLPLLAGHLAVEDHLKEQILRRAVRLDVVRK